MGAVGVCSPIMKTDMLFGGSMVAIGAILYGEGEFLNKNGVKQDF